MSGEEVETSQAEVDLKALESFLVGNRHLEQLEALLNAHHLLRLRGRGVEACLRRGGDRDLHAIRCVEQSWLLEAERDGYSDGLRRACTPHAAGSSHHLSGLQEEWRTALASNLTSEGYEKVARRVPERCGCRRWTSYAIFLTAG
jgi:hypothetical protein